jgi:hypothetical protein
MESPAYATARERLVATAHGLALAGQSADGALPPAELAAFEHAAAAWVRAWLADDMSPDGSDDPVKSATDMIRPILTAVLLSRREAPYPIAVVLGFVDIGHHAALAAVARRDP